MTNLHKAAEEILKALDHGWLEKEDEEVKALRQALAQPEQEPAAWINKDGWFRSPKDADAAFRAYAFPLYAAPPKREWVGLTDEEKEKYVVAYFVDKYDRETAVTLMDDYEAVLKEKNGG